MDPIAPLTCGRAGLDPVQLVVSWLETDRTPAWPQLPRGRTLYTHQGRGAIALGCRPLAIGTADEVLMPAYNCGTEVDAVLSTGADVVLYRVDGDARIDIEDLRRRMTRRTRAIYVTHYFGWPQPTADVRAIAREREALLVEDCALALFSADADGPLGGAADAAVYSFPKSLAVPDGGALVLGEPWRGTAPELTTPSSTRIARRCAGLVKRKLVRGVTSSAVRSSERRPDMPTNYYFDPRTARWAASRTTMGLLAQVEPKAVIERRRANFDRLRGRLADVRGARPLFDRLPAGVCPLEFPLLVEDRDRWIADLAARHVATIPWWAGYHRALRWDDFPEACSLKDRVLALPIHQDLGEEAMDYVASQVESLGISRRRR
jgi:perosamine synthetase